MMLAGLSGEQKAIPPSTEAGAMRSVSGVSRSEAGAMRSAASGVSILSPFKRKVACRVFDGRASRWESETVGRNTRKSFNEPLRFMSWKHIVNMETHGNTFWGACPMMMT